MTKYYGYHEETGEVIITDSKRFLNKWVRNSKEVYGSWAKEITEEEYNKLLAAY